jgi:ABC-type sugar transport system ATPase subunit
VARALIKEPQLFLMDEPLSNLDAKLRTSTRQEIRKLYQELNSTFIYVTHDQIEAMSLGDRIAILHEGRIQQFDTPSKIYHEPANTFVASFIGSPPTNLFEPNLTLFQALKEELILKLNHEDLIVGIRPEYFYLTAKNLVHEDDKNAEIGVPLHALEAELVNIENLGEEILVYAKLDETSGKLNGSEYLIAKINNAEYIQLLQEKFIALSPESPVKLQLFFDHKTIYLFDKRSSMRIS